MKNLFKIVLFTFLAFSLNSCLEDEPITDYSEEAIAPIILIPNGNWPSVVKANPVALDFKSTAQIVDLYARVSWSKPLDQAVTVTFQKDATIIDAYNKAFGTNYTELASAAYKRFSRAWKGLMMATTTMAMANENMSTTPASRGL